MTFFMSQPFIIKCFLLLVFGVVFAYVVKRGFKKNNVELSKRTILFVWICPLVVWFVITSLRLIPVGEVGVKAFMGRVYGHPIPAGLHLLPPFIDIFPVSNLRQTVKITSTNESRILTSDGVPIEFDITVPFLAEQKTATSLILVQGVSYKETLIVEAARAAINQSLRKYKIFELLEIDGGEIQTNIKNEINKYVNQEMKNIADERSIPAPKIKILTPQISYIRPPKALLNVLEQTRIVEETKRKALVQVEIAQILIEQKRLEGLGVAAFRDSLTSSNSDNVNNNSVIRAIAELEHARAVMEATKNGNTKMVIAGPNSLAVPTAPSP